MQNLPHSVAQFRRGFPDRRGRVIQFLSIFVFIKKSINFVGSLSLYIKSEVPYTLSKKILVRGLTQKKRARSSRWCNHAITADLRNASERTCMRWTPAQVRITLSFTLTAFANNESKRFTSAIVSLTVQHAKTCLKAQHTYEYPPSRKVRAPWEQMITRNPRNIRKKNIKKRIEIATIRMTMNIPANGGDLMTAKRLRLQIILQKMRRSRAGLNARKGSFSTN